MFGNITLKIISIYQN